MQDFRKLVVWRKAHAPTLEVFALSAAFAKPPYFGRLNQILRAAVSVPAILAEGAGRNGDREFRRFVRIALGSASELEYHLLLARDLGLIPGATHDRVSSAAGEVKRMLSGLAATLSKEPDADS
ncbi:MAG: four helix bundle protein [Acidobacteria bacterium]|nr:four helix bundle protein [Acidobacteriota bacterium]